MKRFILYVLAAFAFAACTQNEIEELSSNKLFVPDNISVGFENADTRIQLLNDKTVWNEGDCVSVFYRSFDNLKWQFQGQTGDRTGELKLIEGYIGNQTMEDVIIVYPYNPDYFVRLSDQSVEARMPAVQYYYEDSYDPACNIMIAQGSDRSFVLKNVCGWVKIELTGDGQAVQSLTLSGNNNEAVAGDISIVASDATATYFSANSSAPSDDSELGGDLVFDDQTITSVKLQCNGTTLSSEPTAFYIALPPQTFTNGFTVEVKCQGYQPMVLQRNDAIAIERNHIQPMQVVEFEAEESDEVDIPNNEIWYTATDQVWPYNEWDFGATLIDNYFDYETGQGILVFDGDVTRIPAGAFSYNGGLTSITLPNSIAEIESFAFDNCWGLTTMTIPDNTTIIAPGAFSSCGNLQEFKGNCVTEDGRCLVLDNVLLAFAPAGITSYTTPSGVRTIAANSFSSSHDLTEIVISEGVEIIGTYAFSSCTNLSTIILPESILHIRAYAFDYCYSLADITLPSNLQSIEDWAFVNCANLTQITIPDSVQEFGQGILAGCYNLEYIDCQYATEDGRSLIIDGCLFAIAPKDLSSYTVPEEATHIGSGALCGLEFPVLLHDNISVIGDNAFERCSFSTITLPANLEYLGYAAFLYCSNLTDVYCTATTPPSMGGMLFGYNSQNRNIYVPLESLEDYKTADGWREFASCIIGYDYETGETVMPTINLGICGTITDWGDSGIPDIAMEYIEDLNMYVAYGVELTDDDSFKLRSDNTWVGMYNIGHSWDNAGYIMEVNTAKQMENGSGSNDIYIAAGGSFDIYINLDTMMLYFMEAGESPENATVQRDRIGIAGSFTEWGDYPDIAMSYDEDMAMYVCYGLTLNEGDQFKLRVNELWDINYGLDNYIAAFPINSFTSLVNNGHNIIVHETGSYDLYFEPNNYEFFFMEAGVDRSEAMDAATITQLPAPQNVRVINESATSFTLTWDYVENASSYKIIDDTGREYTTSDNYFEFTDSDPYTLYWSRVSAQSDSPSYMSSAWVGTYAYTIDVNQSCSWFTQSFTPGQGTEYNHQPYNSLDVTWKGTGVTSISYFCMSTEEYYNDGCSLGYIVANMSGFNGYLGEINSEEGFSGYFSDQYQDCGYILFTLVTNEQGETYMAISESKTESYELSEAESRWIGTWQMTAHKALVYDGENVSIVDREESFTVNITANPNIARYFFVDGFSVLGEGLPIQANLNENNELCLRSGYSTDDAYNGVYAWLSYCIYSDGNEGYNTYNAPVQIFSMDEAGNVSCRLHSDIAYYSDDSTVTYTNIHTEMYVYTYDGLVEYITDSYPVTYRAGEMDMVKLADNRAAKSSAMSANGLQGYKLTPNKKIKRDNFSTLKSDISVVYNM